MFYEIESMNTNQLNELIAVAEKKRNELVAQEKFQTEILSDTNKSLLKAFSCVFQAQAITNILEKNLGEEWAISISGYGKSIRIWNSFKSKQLQEHEYYELYLKVNENHFEVEKSNISDEDLIHVKSFLSIQ